ncbi:MAG TPA: hypothetical protein VM686_07990, partial [Polyangiaceae bacterium]|nr:hypothetical protein [Polyangiaceae bacterium]
MRFWRLLCNFSTTGVLGAVSLLLCGCSDDAEKPDGATPPATTSTDLIGTFQVELAPSSSMTSILGKVSSGPSPAALAWDEAASSGDCKLLKPRVPFCDP